MENAKNLIKQKINNYAKLMRLDRPIGILLLLWPTLWALWLANQGRPPVALLLIFLTGVVVMRSLGCVVNDLTDRKFDAQVQRTKKRPLVTGVVKSKEAILLAFLLAVFALALVLQLNMTTIRLSLVGLLLALSYPWMKRFTHLPQLVLGIAFAWSIPMAFTASNAGISTGAWVLFCIGVIWPFAYDSIYALMDREDDLKAGVKSTAIFFGKHDIVIIALLQLFVILGLLLLGRICHFSFIYYIFALMSCFLILYQFMLLKQRKQQTYYAAFLNNNWLGLSIFVGIYLNFCC